MSALEPCRGVCAVTLVALASALTVAAADDPVPSSPAVSNSELVFAPLVPCRVVDTRLAGGVFGPFEIRNFVFRGPTTNYAAQGGSPTGCGVPGLAGPGPFRNVARAVAVNVVAVGPQGPGDLRAWSPNRPEPNASILNYAQVPGLNVANGIILPLCDEEAADPCVGKDLSVKADVSGTHVLIDVLGYFQVPETLGDVTGVAAGVGLEGGGAAGELSLAVDFGGSGTSATVARSDHNHDALYSPIVHNHDALYSPIAHNHDTRYSLLAHNHDAAYAAIGHNHDAVYSPLAHNHLGQSWTGSAAARGLFVENGSAAVNASGLWARATGTAAVSGILGEATGGTGNNAGVIGLASSVTGTGVQGVANAVSGITRGVFGTTSSPDGMGVLGTSFASSGTSAGVRGNTRSPDGFGVWAETLISTGTGIALFANAASDAGWAGYFMGARSYFEGPLGIGTDTPTNRLHVQASLNFDATPAAHVALIENTSTGTSPDVLALKVRTTGPVTATNNFITFFNAADASLGSIEGNGSGGVVFAGPGNDYAEWLPRAAAGGERELEPGDVVGVAAGRVGLAVPPGARAMVVSTAPIVAGNDPGAGRRRDHALVALLGQAEVRVRGPVAAGDYLVPSGRNDGTAVAVPQAEASPEALGQVIGQAWGSLDGPGVQRVRALVGLFASDPLARLLVDRDRDQRREIAALRGRLDDLERRLASAVDAGVRAKVAMER
jgi:hypothetical protein